MAFPGSSWGGWDFPPGLISSWPGRVLRCSQLLVAPKRLRQRVQWSQWGCQEVWQQVWAGSNPSQAPDDQPVSNLCLLSQKPSRCSGIVTMPHTKVVCWYLFVEIHFNILVAGKTMTTHGKHECSLLRLSGLMYGRPLELTLFNMKIVGSLTALVSIPGDV